jgi:NAD(P)-dependent dehydrogenase (short-subunit alcohol dehydrogenase family)
MASKHGGVILNIASDLSVIAPDQRLYEQEGVDALMQPVKPVTYSVIKTGLIGLTRYLASYWANKNIRVNALSPGGVFNNHDIEFVKKLSKLIPLGRMAHRDEYKGAIQFLCSDASSYMTGQNLILDGGRSII